MRAWWARRARDDRGAALVEAALMFPVLAMLAFGIAEFGLGWKDSMTVATGLRAASRVEATAGSDPLADYAGLRSIQDSLGGISRIDKVIVFNANTDTAPSSTCLGKTVSTDKAVGVGDATSGHECNVYGAAQLADAASGGSTRYGGAGSAVDRFFNPTARKDRLSDPPTFVGIYVKAHHNFITGLFGSSGLDITDISISRIEPA